MKFSVNKETLTEMNHICKYCKTPFYSRLKKSVVCKSKDCKNLYNQEKYKKRLKECVCTLCGNTYFATDKQSKLFCKNCVRKNPYNYKNTFEKQIFCKHCSQLIRTETKNVIGKNYKKESFSGICEQCKKNNYQKSSERMKLYNPTYKTPLTEKEYLQKQENKKQTEIIKNFFKPIQIKINKEKQSEKMKLHNPMKNPEIIAKCLKTRLQNIETGKTKILRGKDRKGFKGTRTIQNYLRLNLSSWKKELMEANNYTCDICGKNNCYLNVHHKEPFRNIVSKFCELLNINLSKIVYGDEQYLELEKQIIEYHTKHKEIGQVVCELCHAKIDKYFKPRKGTKDEQK